MSVLLDVISYLSPFSPHYYSNNFPKHTAAQTILRSIRGYLANKTDSSLQQVCEHIRLYTNSYSYSYSLLCLFQTVTISFHCKFDFMCAFTYVNQYIYMRNITLVFPFPIVLSLPLPHYFSPTLPYFPLHLLFSPFTLSTYLLPLPSLISSFLFMIGVFCIIRLGELQCIH